jgi:regulator of sigma E protease
MFSGSISVRENLGGPVAIASITKEATDAGGAIGFWNITALLSITLAIMNILPIPVLDGGHLMFLIYEGITRKEPSPKVRMALQQIGFLLIIALFIFVTFNDIIRQFG